MKKSLKSNAEEKLVSMAEKTENTPQVLKSTGNGYARVILKNGEERFMDKEGKMYTAEELGLIKVMVHNKTIGNHYEYRRLKDYPNVDIKEWHRD